MCQRFPGRGGARLCSFSKKDEFSMDTGGNEWPSRQGTVYANSRKCEHPGMLEIGVSKRDQSMTGRGYRTTGSRTFLLLVSRALASDSGSKITNQASPRPSPGWSYA